LLYRLFLQKLLTFLRSAVLLAFSFFYAYLFALLKDLLPVIFRRLFRRFFIIFFPKCRFGIPAGKTWPSVIFLGGAASASVPSLKPARLAVPSLETAGRRRLTFPALERALLAVSAWIAACLAFPARERALLTLSPLRAAGLTLIPAWERALLAVTSLKAAGLTLIPASKTALLAVPSLKTTGLTLIPASKTALLAVTLTALLAFAPLRGFAL
jgi:hypothetical protein